MSWVCLSCLDWDGAALCAACAATLAPSGESRLATGLVVRPAFRHEGAARRLVHRLKYQGHPAAAALLARAMARGVPPGAAALVPVPRARLRRWRYGIDPARELATALHEVTGLPVVAALRAGWWWPAHAGRDRYGRAGPPFSGVRVAGAVLVDDVLTTGSTLAAADTLVGEGAVGAVTATAARPTTLSRDAAVGYSGDEPLAG